MKLTETLRTSLSPQKSKIAEARTRTQGTQTATVEMPKVAWQGERDNAGIPLRMLCPISQSIMHDPVVASDGHTYDRPMITKILANKNRVSPMTREKLEKRVFANGSLQREVVAFLQAEPQHAPQLSAGQMQALAQAEQSGVLRHRAIAILLASSLPEASTAEAFLYEMPIANGSAVQSASIPPGHPGSSIAPPRRPPSVDSRATRLAHLEAMTAEWHAALDDAAQQALSTALPRSLRRLPGFDDLAALQDIDPNRLAAIVGAQPRADSLRSESSIAPSAQSSRRLSQASAESFDFDAFFETHRDDPDDR